MTNIKASDTLDALLAAIEDEILGCDGMELLSDSPAEVTETAAFISRRRAAGTTVGNAVKPWVRRVRGLPRSKLGRRRLLNELVAQRRTLPERVAVAFANGEPDDKDIPALLRDLLGGDNVSED